MNKYFLLLSLLVTLGSCTTELPSADAKTKIIGHGGMGITHDFPLNSFEGIAFAMHKGAHGVEMDVQMTLDSVLVAYHHEKLEYNMKGIGQIHNKLWEEVRNEEYTELLYAEYGVVSLEDLFSNMPQFADRMFFFDIKTFSPDTTGVYEAAVARQLYQIIDRYALTNTVVEIKSISAGLRYKTMRPKQAVFLYTDMPQVLDSCVAYGFQGIVQDIDQLSSQLISRADSLGLKVACINTHSHDRNDEAHSIGVHYNQTDMVNYALRNF